MIKRILVGVAGTASTAAKIAATIEIAQRHAASVSLVSVIDRDRLERVGPVPLGAAHYAQTLRRDRLRAIEANAEGAMEQFADACRQAQVPCRIMRKEGPPLDVLAAEWRTHDLCVLGLRGWFSAGVMPEPEDALLHLLRLGVRPILAIPEQAQVPVLSVLVAYDGSPEAAKAMKRCVQMRPWGDVPMHLVAFDAPTAAVRAELEEAARYVGAHGLEVSIGTCEQPLADGFEREAERRGADALAMGIAYRASLLGGRFDVRAAAVLKASARPVFLTH